MEATHGGGRARPLILLAVGAALWLVNRLVDGPPEEGFDADRLRGG
jgi:hypothetical protein